MMLTKGPVRSVLYDREGRCCRSCDALLENSSPMIGYARMTMVKATQSIVGYLSSARW